MKPRWRDANTCGRFTDLRRLAGAIALFLTLAVARPAGLLAQSVQAQPAQTLAQTASEASGETATLVYFNRPIVDLRARVLGRNPADRAAAAERTLDDLVAQRITGPVETRSFEGGVVLFVGSRGVLALTSADVDMLAGETVDEAARLAADHLRQALDEAAEAHAPRELLREMALSALAVLLGVAVLWGLVSIRQAIVRRLLVATAGTVARTGMTGVDLGPAAMWFSRAVTALCSALALVVAYADLTFVLRRFPFTRPWGESMTGVLLASVENLGAGIIRAIPGLFTAALILLLARLCQRLIRFWFDAIERGTTTVGWIYPETAQPTRRLLTVLLWLFALAMAYPYLPGSQSEAFKGMSVFLGLMVTFGSSGLVNQIVSGFMITYSRALRVGDFVKIGEVEGTVFHLGVLSTKVRTVQSEEVTVPNAVVIAQTTTDYSRGDAPVFTPVSVTIGYDVPWRQVEAMLLLAAGRTPGIRRDPAPWTIQAALQDFYVKYTLLVCLEHQDMRLSTLNSLHAEIQDAFNEQGVQIMSPNYMLDPAKPKVVAKHDWYAAPARPSSPT